MKEKEAKMMKKEASCRLNIRRENICNIPGEGFYNRLFVNDTFTIQARAQAFASQATGYRVGSQCSSDCLSFHRFKSERNEMLQAHFPLHEKCELY